MQREPSSEAIARALVLGDGTVKNHVSNLMSELGARDRALAVLKRLELRLV